MLKSYLSLQQGLLDPRQFTQKLTNKRALALALSKHQDIDHTFSGSVNYLSIDDTENRYLLSGCSDGSISIHDLFNFTKTTYFTAKCVAKVRAKSKYAHEKSAECVTWFPSDNALFVSSGGDKRLKLWDTNLLRPIDVIDCKGRVNHHQCSLRSRSHIAVGTNANVVELVDLRTGHGSHELRGHRGSVMAVAWSPREGSLLASAGLEGETKLWDVRSAASHLLDLTLDDTNSAHRGLVNGLSFTPDGLHIVTYGSDKHLRVWDSLRGRPLPANFGRIRNDSWRNVQIAVTDQFTFVPSKGHIQVLDLWTGETVSSLLGHFNRVQCCVIRQCYHELYSGGNDRNVMVWTADDPLEAIPADNLPTADQWSSDDGDDGIDDDYE